MLFHVSLTGSNWWGLIVLIMLWVHNGHVCEMIKNKAIKDWMSQNVLRGMDFGYDVFSNWSLPFVPVIVRGDFRSCLEWGAYFGLINKAFASDGNMAEAQTRNRDLPEMHQAVLQNKIQEKLRAGSGNAWGTRLEAARDLFDLYLVWQPENWQCNTLLIWWRTMGSKSWKKTFQMKKDFNLPWCFAN